jgi:hypothetical protein
MKFKTRRRRQKSNSSTNMKIVHFVGLRCITPSYLTAAHVRGTGAFEMSKLHLGVVNFLMLSTCVLYIMYHVTCMSPKGNRIGSEITNIVHRLCRNTLQNVP